MGVHHMGNMGCVGEEVSYVEKKKIQFRASLLGWFFSFFFSGSFLIFFLLVIWDSGFLWVVGIKRI